MRYLKIFLPVFAVSLLAVSSADAAQRFAAPVALGSGNCSSAANACTLTTATGGAITNDEVILAPGTYTLGSTLFIGGFEVHGTAGQAQPVIQTTANTGISLGPTDSKLADVRINHTTGGTTPAVFASGNTQISRVEAISTGTGCQLIDFATIRDSVCAGGTAVFESGLAYYAGSPGLGQVRNVTAVGNVGLFAGTSTPTGYTVSVDVRNSILRGSASDISAVNAGSTNTTNVTLQRSNYDSVSPASGGTANITAVGSGTNQAAAPQFLNEPGGNYRQAAGSPTIDAGATDALTGTLDLDRVTRPQGAAIDIGAYEFTPPAVTPADTTPPETTIDKGPKKRSTKKKATFLFSSSEAGSTFVCKVDKKAEAPCTSPLKLKGLKRGKHTLTVVATDAAGNADATEASYGWKVKKKKPKK